MKTITCMECGSATMGRSDKKFCNDMCRNAYNNRLNSDETAMMRNVNNALRRNRRILKKLLSERTQGTARVPFETLAAEGFHFGYFTHIKMMMPETPCYFCYEYGYQKQEELWYTVLHGDMVMR